MMHSFDTKSKVCIILFQTTSSIILPHLRENVVYNVVVKNDIVSKNNIMSKIVRGGSGIKSTQRSITYGLKLRFSLSVRVVKSGDDNQ